MGGTSTDTLSGMSDLTGLLPTPGETVDLVCFDYQCRLTFGDGTGVVLGSWFRLKTAVAEHLIDPEDTANATLLLRVLHDELRTATVSEQGELSLAFDSGILLTAPVDEHHEAWQIVHADGRQAIAMPGGEIAVCPAKPSETR